MLKSYFLHANRKWLSTTDPPVSATHTDLAEDIFQSIPAATSSASAGWSDSSRPFKRTLRTHHLRLDFALTLKLFLCQRRCHEPEALRCLPHINIQLLSNQGSHQLPHRKNRANCDPSQGTVQCCRTPTARSPPIGAFA